MKPLETPRWRRYLRFWGPDPAADVEDEFGFHLQERIDDLVALGVEYGAAREAALRGFGDIERVKTACRDLAWEKEKTMRRSEWVDAVRQDVLFSLRQMRSQLSLTVAAVLTLALGIGGTTAIFSVVNNVLLRPLPYANADRLVIIWETFRDFQRGRASPAHYSDWAEQSRVLEAAAAWGGRTVNLTSDGDPERVQGALVTPNFFDVQHMAPELGRYFRPDEGEARVVVLSYNFWQQRFAGDRAILGRDITLNGEQFTVIGVTPRAYTLTEFDERLWTPIQFTPEARSNYWDHGMLVVGRLKPGVAREQAQADLVRVTEDIRRRQPDAMANRGVNVEPLVDVLVGRYRTQLWVLLGAVGFVLLIACGNVASLLLARATTRRKELAIRGALGGGRARLVRQLLTESLVLSLVGGAAGVLVAYYGVRFLVGMGPAGLPRLQEAGLHAEVLGFALAATLVSGLLFGLAPALRATRADLQSVLREGGKSSRGVVRDRLRSLLVVGEIAVALVLLVSAGLFVRSALRVQRVEPGFDPNGVTMLRIALPADRYESPDAVQAGFIRLLEEIRAMPGVELAGASTRLPLWGANMDMPVDVQGEAYPEGEAPIAHIRLAGGDYFDALGIGLRQGRVIQSADLANGAARVIVVNETFARAAFGNENPIGRFVNLWGSSEQPIWREIVGVVSDVRSFGREAEAPGEIYIPFTQPPQNAWLAFQRSLAFVVRAPDGAVTAAALRRAVSNVDPMLPLFDVRTMDEVMALASSARRFNTLLLSGLGLIGLILAAIGIYGVIAFFVTQRTHEIGVRLTLGATTRDVIALVLGQGVRLAALGVLLGAAASAAATRALQSLLFEVDALDPLTYVACAAVLGAVAIAATLIPARRAARVQPGASLMAAITLVLGHALLPASAQAQTSQSLRSSQERLLQALQGNRLAITMTEGRPAGPGWDFLVREARDARFTLIGEEHGVAETAQLSAALFATLRGSGYSRLAIELSPPIAKDVEAAARRNGLQGIRDFLETPGVFTFYNMREETQFLADVFKAAATNERILWGFDREIFSDRYLIARLETKVPVSAREPFARLKQAQANAWAQYDRSPSGDNLFLLSGDPALVTAVRNAWRNPDAESDAILRTLEESLAIEAAENAGGIWPYMQRRTQWARDNVAALLKDGLERKPSPKVVLKGGYNHMIRGTNYLNYFDLGAMADEVAALSGDRAFHVIVLPGPGSRQAVPGAGRSFGSVSSDEYDELRAGDQRLTRVLSNPNAAGHEVIDLRALRRLAMRGLESWNADVVRTIHGYDAAVIWKGASASSGLK